MRALRLLFLLCRISGLLTGAWSQFQWKDTTCPKGWSRLGDHCYIYHNRERTFSDAERACKTFGGNLVSIHNARENAFVLELIREGGDDDRAWIGLKDSDFVWTDGTVVDFTVFNSGGEPDDTGNCVQISGSVGLCGTESSGEESTEVAPGWPESTETGRAPLPHTLLNPIHQPRPQKGD
ncbi:galactose-specific lectin nattectin-like [Festucalex cinctus]